MIFQWSQLQQGQFNHCVIGLVGNYYSDLLLRMKKKKWYCFIQKLALIFLRPQAYVWISEAVRYWFQQHLKQCIFCLRFCCRMSVFLIHVVIWGTAPCWTIRTWLCSSALCSLGFLCVTLWVKSLFHNWPIDQSHKGGCRALHVHSHTWPRLCKFYLRKMLWSKELSCCPEWYTQKLVFFFSELDFEKQEVW